MWYWLFVWVIHPVVRVHTWLHLFVLACHLFGSWMSVMTTRQRSRCYESTCVLLRDSISFIIIFISGGPKNWHNFLWDIISKPSKTICKTLYNIFAIMSIILWVISSNRQQNVVKTVVWKLHIEKSNIVDTSNIGWVWHALCMAYCCDQEVPGLSMKPNCHSYHFKYSLNRCIAQ